MTPREKYQYVNSVARFMRNSHHFVRNDRYNEFYEPDEYEMPLGKLELVTGIEPSFFVDRHYDEKYHWLSDERYWRFNELKNYKWYYVMTFHQLENPLSTIERWIGLCSHVR